MVRGAGPAGAAACLVCLGLWPGSAEPASPAELEGPVQVHYRFPPPVARRAGAFHRLTIGGAPSLGAPGAPVLPRRLAFILLPEGTTVDRVAVRPGPSTLLDGRYQLEPGGPEHAPTDRKPPAMARPDPDAYQAQGPIPPEPFEFRGVGWKHGRAIALVSLWPAAYYPARGEVAYRSEIEVEVYTRPVPGPKRRTAGPSPALTLDLAGLVDNPPPRARPKAAAPPGGGAEEVAYAIVTSSELAPDFEPLAAARTAGGLPARVFTTESIYALYEGLRPDGGTDDATRIRNFIRDQYQNHGLRYVLLGGDADGAAGCPGCGPVVVPVRRLQTEAIAANPIPSDLYYGCLDGTFDGDGDGVYGEAVDGPDGGDVDLLFEVSVGRAPVDTPEEARAFVAKTLAYPETPVLVLREVLLVGERLGFGGEYDWGGNLNDQIRSGSGSHFSSLGFESSPYRDFFRVAALDDRDDPAQD
ncbi:MAG: C25 family cysteine peptidase, partial [Thermoanaerobaculia bacterium]